MGGEVEGPRVVTVRGEGGGLFEMDVPVAPNALELFEAKLRNGQLVLVDEDGVPQPASVYFGDVAPVDPSGGLDQLNVKDLRALAAALDPPIDGRKLKRAELIEAIGAHSPGGDSPEGSDAAPDANDTPEA